MGKYNLPALTAGIQNQGLNNYVPRTNATVLQNVISISANGANTGSTFYQTKEFTVLQDAYAIRWIYSDEVLTDNQHIFLVASISRRIYGNYEWTNKAGWAKVQNEMIFLPTKNGEIDFDFMDAYISELEEERISELEEERISELAAYLTVSGFDNDQLSNAETQALEMLGSIEWVEVKIIDHFTVKNTKNILSRDVVLGGGDTPYLCASASNNSIAGYITYREDYKDNGNCIFIGGKTFVVSYQEHDFYSNDSHNLALYMKDEHCVNKYNQLFLATSIKKSLGSKYSWGNSISNKKIQTDTMMLPTHNGTIDYAYMDTLLSAVHKLVIKDVVYYTDAKLNATKRVVHND